jgi:hypothetical protein
MKERLEMFRKRKSKPVKECTFVYNVQFTTIHELSEDDEPRDADERNRNIEKLLREHNSAFDDIKVISSQVFERDLE